MVLPRVNHINTVFERNADDVILSKVSSDGSESLANLVRLISLYASHYQLLRNACTSSADAPSDDEQRDGPRKSR